MNAPMPKTRRINYTFNHEFFEKIDSEAKAYFLGLMFADGNISVNHTTNVIRLTSKDKDILERFLLELESDCRIYREMHNKYKTEIFKVRLSSKKMYDDLHILGCTERKSLTLLFPCCISNEMIHHFIRGYFDGDGTVGAYQGTKSSVWKKLMSGFCGTEMFLTELVNHLPVRKKGTTKRINLSLLSFSVEDSLKLYNYMYRDATIYLKRKKKVFDDYIEQRASTTTIGNLPRRLKVKV